MAIALMQDPDRLAQRIADIRSLAELLELNVLDRFGEVGRLIGKGKLSAQRKRTLETLTHWASIWRDLVHEGYQADTVRHNPDLLDEVRRVTGGLAPVQGYAALRTIVDAQQAVASNANLRLTLEAVLLDLPNLTMDQRGANAARPSIE
jgi:hypothetical protein